MSRPKRPDTRVRTQLELTEGERALVEKLRMDTSESSGTDVLRRALRVYGKLMGRVNEGATLVIRAADGKEETIWMI